MPGNRKTGGAIASAGFIISRVRRDRDFFAGWTAVCRPFHSCVLCRSFRKRPRAGCFARYNLLISPRYRYEEHGRATQLYGQRFLDHADRRRHDGRHVVDTRFSGGPGEREEGQYPVRPDPAGGASPAGGSRSLFRYHVFGRRPGDRGGCRCRFAGCRLGRRTASRRTGNTGVGMGSAGIPADARARSLRERGNGNRFGGARCDRGFRRRGSGHGAFLPYDARKGPPAARPDRRSRRLVHRGRYRDGRCARADAGSVRRLRRRLRTFLVSDRAVQGYGAAYVRRLENLRRQGVPESARGRTGQVFRVGQRLHSPAGRDGAHGGRDFPQAYRCGARGADSVYQSGQHLAARRGQRLARARFPARPESARSPSR